MELTQPFICSFNDDFENKAIWFAVMKAEGGPQRNLAKRPSAQQNGRVIFLSLGDQYEI